MWWSHREYLFYEERTAFPNRKTVERHMTCWKFFQHLHWNVADWGQQGQSLSGPYTLNLFSNPPFESSTKLPPSTRNCNPPSKLEAIFRRSPVVASKVLSFDGERSDPSFHDSPTDDHRAFVLRSSRDETKDKRDLQILFPPLKCSNGIGRETGD